MSGVIAVVAGLLVAGCGSAPVPREATPAFPRRPIDIPTGELAPCGTLSPAQRVALGLYGGEADVATVNGLPSPGCSWLSDSDLNFATQTFPIGAEMARSQIGAVVVDVNGFGAVVNVVREMTGGAPTCQVTVDAGPAQSIRVQVQATGERPRTDEEMCRIATDVTGMVMTTVVATVRR